VPVGYLSGGTTNFSNVSGDEIWASTFTGAYLARVGSAAAPTFAFTSEASLGVYRSGVSTIAPSYGTLNLFTNAVRLSKNTVANPNGLNIGELAIVFAASGISLVYSSGASYYIIGGSASSAAQA